MKIRLVSCNFGESQSLIINNQEEIEMLNVDVKIYDDSNTSSRLLAMHPRLKGKIPKMLEWHSSPGYNYYIWVDSKFTLNNGIIETLINQLGNADLGLFNHSHRNSIQSELDYVNLLIEKENEYLKKRYVGEDMNAQVSSYLKDKTFIDDKLFAAGCFIYSAKLVENRDYNLLKEWFLHNNLYSIQDQLSLPYLLHRFKTNYITFDFDLLNTKLLDYN
jgi:hypothetical protein